MGILPGVCKSCGGKMLVVEIIPNRYRKKQRAPPGWKEGIQPYFSHKPKS
jgi:hypothetical protein